MRPNRTLRVGFALLFALMLPLQGYAAMPGCGQPDHAIRNSAAHHCTREPAVTHHSSCGDCCGAVATAPSQGTWAAPRPAAIEVSSALIWYAPAVALHRLDRPPRLTAV